MPSAILAPVSAETVYSASAVYGRGLPAPEKTLAKTLQSGPGRQRGAPVDRLDAALRQLSPKPSGGFLGGAVAAKKPGQLSITGVGGEADVTQELADLRDEVSQLRSDMDLYLGQYVAELRQENQELRRQLEYSRGGAGTQPGAPEGADSLNPIDGGSQGGAFIQGAPDAPTPATSNGSAPSPEPKGNGSGEMALAVHGGLNYAVITEWGRSPAEAAQWGKGISSLKGMVCVVPEGSSDAQLLSLGRYFRKEYKDYDNINIQVFDTQESANTYVNTNNPSPEHRVLTVTKHKRSGLDTILVLRNGTLTEVGPPPGGKPSG